MLAITPWPWGSYTYICVFHVSEYEEAKSIAIPELPKRWRVAGKITEVARCVWKHHLILRFSPLSNPNECAKVDSKCVIVRIGGWRVCTVIVMHLYSYGYKCMLSGWNLEAGSSKTFRYSDVSPEMSGGSKPRWYSTETVSVRYTLRS